MASTLISPGYSEQSTMLTSWNTEEVFLDGDHYFDRILKDIQSAKSSITIEVYMFNDDLLGREVAHHLIAAHARGVKVEVIVDGMGSHRFFDFLYGEFLKNHLAVKVYNPLPFVHPYYGQLTFTKKIYWLINRLIKLNKRDHRKIFTIDETIMYVGSFNVTVEHTLKSDHKPWKDMGVRVTGDQVKFAVLNFKKNWKITDFYQYRKKIRSLKLPSWRFSPLRLNNTLFMRRYFNKNFNQRIFKSKKRIWLMTPYFIPERKLVMGLARAAKRGVDVRLLIASKTDVELFRTLQYFYYPFLIKSGVKVFQYTDTVLHAKNYIIDEWVTVGSSNLNHRSLMHDLEVDLAIQDKVNLKMIEDHFESSVKNLEALSFESLRQRSLWDKIMSGMYFIFRYWF